MEPPRFMGTTWPLMHRAAWGQRPSAQLWAGTRKTTNSVPRPFCPQPGSGGVYRSLAGAGKGGNGNDFWALITWETFKPTGAQALSKTQQIRIWGLRLRNVYSVKLRKGFIYTGKTANLCPAFLVPRSRPLRLHKGSCFCFPPWRQMEIGKRVCISLPSLRCWWECQQDT